MKKRDDIYDLYWYFAYERQNIFYNKLKGKTRPWTKDPILQNYKFCNAYRVNDRISQYLIKNVIYNGKEYSNKDIIFRIMLFKLFNKSETWELLCNKVGDIKLSSFSFDKYSSILSEAKSKGVVL